MDWDYYYYYYYDICEMVFVSMIGSDTHTHTNKQANKQTTNKILSGHWVRHFAKKNHPV